MQVSSFKFQVESWEPFENLLNLLNLLTKMLFERGGEQIGSGGRVGVAEDGGEPRVVGVGSTQVVHLSSGERR